MKVVTVEQLHEAPYGFTGLIVVPKFRKIYKTNGRFHREDGPAVIWNDGGMEWWLNGKLHREDGPAIQRASNWKQWWVNGDFVHQNDEAYIKPLIIERRMAQKGYIVDLVDPELKQLPNQYDYIVLEDNIQGHNQVTNQDITFKKILTKDSFAYIPNLPGM